MTPTIKPTKNYSIGNFIVMNFHVLVFVSNDLSVLPYFEPTWSPLWHSVCLDYRITLSNFGSRFQFLVAT